MERFFYFLLIVGLSCSCRKETLASSSTTLPVLKAKTYLALGDSYTIGQSVAQQDRFPAQTVMLLKAQGINISDPFYIAQTGWTTTNLQQAITNTNPSPTYDVVTLLIGVNDQYQKMDTGGYAIRFQQLLITAIQMAGGNKKHVFVLSIPDYSATPFVADAAKLNVRKELEWFNKINKRITTTSEVDYTDITPSTQEAATNPSLVATDQLHPSALEYKKWAEMLAPKMKEVLQ